MSLDAKAADKLSKGWYGERLDRSDCEYLLTFRDKSSETNLALSLANRIAHKACSNVGQICANIITEENDESIPDSLLSKYSAELGGFSDVKSIRLTAENGTDFEDLCHMIQVVKNSARRGTRIYVSASDLNLDECKLLKNEGVFGAYCPLNMDEDAGVKKDRRLKTVTNLVSAGLAVTSTVGPIGPEQECKEIVEQFFTLMDCRCSGIEIYAREPVPGTNTNQYGRITPARLNQFRSIFTLASSWYTQPVRSAFPGTLVCNQNLAVAEYNSKNGKAQIEAARRKLFNSGFDRLLKTDDTTVELNLMYLRQTGSV